ncbi:MAG: glycosyltransferase family 4 protein [Flavobacteriales bacterium]|nr:glycosyltransferase family 4 protein [Flavobacteriales bacterium]
MNTNAADRATVLVLYTELAPYVLACLHALVEQGALDVHLVRWPVNSEAPFQLDFQRRLTVHERASLSDAQLLELALRLRPKLVIASGWVDRGYVATCKALKRQGATTAVIIDTAWRGHWRQWANALVGRWALQRAYSHAWVTGQAQATYARRLGFKTDRIRTGFYSADTTRFLAVGQRLLSERTGFWPHRFLCVARYIPTKGQQLLCDAFAELCEADEAGDWELWLAGTGELHQQVVDSPAGRHRRIRHLGFKQPEEMETVMEQCGAFVLPSAYEPWGVVVHEFACAGFPLILSSAVGAAERFLVETENGFRFIAGDKSSLKKMLRMIVLSNDHELLGMGQRSHALGGLWSPQSWADTAMALCGAGCSQPLNLQPSTSR